MADQLSFDWPSGVALGPEDFFVSQANAQAFAMLSAPDTWPEGKLVVTGPSGAGTSHMASIFRTQSDALLLNAISQRIFEAPRSRLSLKIWNTCRAPQKKRFFICTTTCVPAGAYCC